MSMMIEPQPKEYTHYEMWDTISELYLQYSFTWGEERWTSEMLDVLFKYHDEWWECTVDTRDWSLSDYDKVKWTFDTLWNMGYIDNHFVKYHN